MHEQVRGPGSTLPQWKLPRQIVTAHGSVNLGTNWTNFDETWDMLQAICESTPDAPMLTNVNVAQPLLVGGSAIIVVILILVYFWLTGN